VPAMVLRAKELSSQVSTLDGAIELLEKACTRDPMVRDEYAELLSFWKRGIVQ
jgi:hypothetical protein